MNLALWLERAGKSHAQRVAVGVGGRTLRTYGELAARDACRRIRPVNSFAARVSGER